MRKVAFVWDNFGPMHADRCDAVQAYLGESFKVYGVEQYGTSDTYDWIPEHGAGFTKLTVSDASGRSSSTPRKFILLLKAIRKTGARDVFFCNYERFEVFFAAAACALSGRRCYVMGCAKFDDMPRYPIRELIKSFFFLPYRAAIASGTRSRDYMRFLGIRADRIVGEYNTLSVDRIRAASGAPPAPDGVDFDNRHFTIVARLVPKKNLSMAIEAYAKYCSQCDTPRTLLICGSGPLENDLRSQAKALDVGDTVLFSGFLQTEDIAQALSRSLCLILPSIEEQFGNVVIEAQAVGVPCIVSVVAGARDTLIRSGVNGFLIEPDNPAGLAWMMRTISTDRDLWQRFATESLRISTTNDVMRFAEAVSTILQL